MSIPIVIPPPHRRLRANDYFDADMVEYLLVLYVLRGCTKVQERDIIMSKCDQLIRKTIINNGYHRLYGRDESSFMDLYQAGWVQIERALYKYQARAHCADCFDYNNKTRSVIFDPPVNNIGIIKPREIATRHLTCPKCGKEPKFIIYKGTGNIFAMFLQIVTTSVLAYIKKETSLVLNRDQYTAHLNQSKPSEHGSMIRFLKEAREKFRYHEKYLRLIDVLEYIYINDATPSDGLIQKMVRYSSSSRTQINEFMRSLRLMRDDFSDGDL